MKTDREENIQQNPNDQASIGFVIAYPFFFYVHKNIYKHLATKSEFIIDAGATHSTGESKEILKDIIKLLEKHGVHYRILYYEDYYSEKFLKKFFSKYQALVSPWDMKGLLELEATSGIKKINTPYGAGKELSKVRPSRAMFDLILAAGSRDNVLYSYYTRSEIVGSPKFDDWFNNTLDSVTIQNIQSRLDSRKKTILHLPTHSDLAETHSINDDIGALTKTYNVITKLHYNTVRDHPHLAEELSKKNIIVFKDETDLLCLLKLADLVLADNSSAIFDAILADKPILLSYFTTEDYLDNVHRTGLPNKKRSSGKSQVLTYSQSIEQQIKKNCLVPTFQKNEQLDKKIEETMSDSTFFKEARKKIREELFSFNDGKCGERAAALIEELLLEKEPAPRPILYHAMDAYRKSLGIPPLASKRYKKSKFRTILRNLWNLKFSKRA